MLRKVHKKKVWTPPSAHDYNAMAMAGERYLAGPDSSPERQQPVNPCTAWIKNTSGADRRLGECLEMDVDPQLDKVTRENTWIKGIECDDETIPFAIMLRPVFSDKWQLGQVAGICPGLVDIQDTDHRWAFLAEGEYVLTSTSSKAIADVCIVQHPGETGEQLCVVLFGTQSQGLVELCLSENHPGRGIKFAAKLGWWDPSTDGWRYESSGSTCLGSGTVAAIDWRFGVPYPDAGTKGLFTQRPSDTYGVIYECVSLDCESPDADCCTYVTGE